MNPANPLPEPLSDRISPALDAQGVRLPASEVVDILFDGRRIWSIDPSLHDKDAEGLAAVPWPAALRPRLHGVTRATVRDHTTHELLFEEELAFGSSTERVQVVDASGQPLAFDKWGDLVKPFDSADESAITATLEQTAEVIEALREECGLPAFITYGALLGAVRNGALIGHDNDIDVAYMSAHSHPVDVARESFRVQHQLAQRGWDVHRVSAGFMQVSVEKPDAVVGHVDVFACFHALDRFYQVFAVEADLPRSAILPLAEVTLHGMRLPAPADAEALLEATYGPSWRVPDPSFEFKAPEQTRRRIGGRGGWFGGYSARRRYWRDFYGGDRSAAIPDEPSPFARWVGGREPTPTSVVDIGSGTGRDTLWFAREGHRSLGLDYVPVALDHARTRANADGLDASFEYFDLYDLRQVLALGGRLAHDPNGQVLYGRFLLHALEDGGRHNLWRLAGTALRTGGRLYLEFRTGRDADKPHEFGEHFRRYLDGDVVVGEIDSHGGRVEHVEEGHGLAVYRHEDPHVCRLVATWQA